MLPMSLRGEAGRPTRGSTARERLQVRDRPRARHHGTARGDRLHCEPEKGEGYRTKRVEVECRRLQPHKEGERIENETQMMDGEASLLALWIVSAAAAVGLTVRWFRLFSDSKAYSAIVWTSVAGAPGVTLLLESAGRYAQRSITGASPQAFELPSTLVSCLWLVVGPVLFAVGFSQRRSAHSAPPGTNLVQLTHVVMWVWSTVIGWLFAATV